MAAVPGAHGLSPRHPGDRLPRLRAGLRSDAGSHDHSFRQGYGAAAAIVLFPVVLAIGLTAHFPSRVERGSTSDERSHEPHRSALPGAGSTPPPRLLRHPHRVRGRLPRADPDAREHVVQVVAGVLRGPHLIADESELDNFTRPGTRRTSRATCSNTLSTRSWPMVTFVVTGSSCRWPSPVGTCAAPVAVHAVPRRAVPAAGADPAVPADPALGLYNTRPGTSCCSS